jgi:hypothetical protein
MARPPRAVHVPWTDLLTKRTLLHEHLRSFRDAADFVTRATSEFPELLADV